MLLRTLYLVSWTEKILGTVGSDERQHKHVLCKIKFISTKLQNLQTIVQVKEVYSCKIQLTVKWIVLEKALSSKRIVDLGP